MNKETFLEELRGYLRILEDQEQEDILEEYAQHIDMKLQKGLSEEEAIRDFGSMRELAAEILEAYHVKPEFDKKSSSYQPEIKWNKMKDTGKQFRKMGSFLKNKTKACIHGISRCFHWCGRKCRALALWVWKPFPKAGTGTKDGKTEEAFIHMQDTGLTGREAGDFPVNHMDRTPQMPKEEGSLNIVKTVNIAQRRKRGWISAFLRGLIKTWDLFAAFCIWWIRLFWNLLWLFMALFFGDMALITLAGVGVILVLLPQGYPMVGMLLICLGGMLCMGALCCGSYSLILRRKKEEQETEKHKTEKRETEKQEIVEQETEEQETEEQETEALVPSRSDYRIGERE